MSAKRVWLAALIAALACGLALSAFATGTTETGGTPKAKPVTLTTTYATGDPLTKDVTHEIITRFMAANPTIDIVEDLTISTGAYADTLKVKDSVGQFPDFVEMRDTPMFVRAGKLAPLPQELLPLFEAPIAVYGTVYTAPYSAAGPNGIMYNRKFFKDNGFTEPKTYGEFLQLCDKIKATGVAPLVAGISDIWHLGFWFGHFWVNNIGTKYPNWMADRYAGKVKFTDPDFSKGIHQLVDLFTKGYVEAGYMSTKESQAPAVLIAGKAAMYYCGAFVFKQILDADPMFDLGWFPVPDDTGAVKLMGGATANGWSLSAAAAKDPEKVKAFDAFIRFFFTKEQYTYFLQSTNSFPTTKEKMTYTATPTMQTVLSIFVKAPKSLNWNNGVGANELPPPFRNWTYKKLQEAMLGEITVEEALRKMDEEFDKEARDFNPSTLKPQALTPPAQ